MSSISTLLSEYLEISEAAYVSARKAEYLQSQADALEIKLRLAKQQLCEKSNDKEPS